jgi:hypothetical protein
VSVYVDALAVHGRWRWGVSCHMVADTLEELHEMADRIGHKREWFQPGDTNPPHYDLAASRRKRAVAAGAIEIDRRQMVRFMREWRRNQGEPGVGR